MLIILSPISMMLLENLIDFSSNSADIDGQNSAMSNLMNLQDFFYFR